MAKLAFLQLIYPSPHAKLELIETMCIHDYNIYAPTLALKLPTQLLSVYISS